MVVTVVLMDVGYGAAIVVPSLLPESSMIVLPTVLVLYSIVYVCVHCALLHVVPSLWLCASLNVHYGR